MDGWHMRVIQFPNDGYTTVQMNVRVNVKRNAERALVIPKAPRAPLQEASAVFTLLRWKAIYGHVNTSLENMNEYVVTDES